MDWSFFYLSDSRLFYISIQEQYLLDYKITWAREMYDDALKVSTFAINLFILFFVPSYVFAKAEVCITSLYLHYSFNLFLFFNQV